MKISCTKLSTSCGKDVYNMLQDIETSENGFSNPAYGLGYEEYKAWAKQQIDNSFGKNLPENYLPCTTYVLYINNEPVGYGRVRHCSNEYLENVAGVGNLGYGVAKQHRGKGYGKILFRELLKNTNALATKK